MTRLPVTRRHLGRALSVLALALSTSFAMSSPAWAADDTADVFIKRLSSDLLDTVKADKTILSGDINKISVLVDQKN